jgi:hypothetical protein
MPKYDPLAQHLAAVPAHQHRVGMPFSDVDQLVHGLPASAHAYQTWWGNNSHVQAKAWRAAGWHVQDVQLSEQRVVFARGSVGGSYAARLGTEDRTLLSGAAPGSASPDDADAVLEDEVWRRRLWVSLRVRPSGIARVEATGPTVQDSNPDLPEEEGTPRARGGRPSGRPPLR